MDTSTPPTAPSAGSSTPPIATAEDKTVAILSYITLLGFIIAIVIHSNKKTRLGAFHLRQVLGLFLTAVAFVVCQFVLIFIPILGWLCIFVLWVSFFVFWIMGLISAIQGQLKPVPIVGSLFQQWFGTTFD